MKKIKVACLFGGCSSEYEISLVSAASVIRNINQDKYDVIMIGITRDGDFYLYEGVIEDIERNQWYRPDVCTKITFSTNRQDHGFIILKRGEERVVFVDVVFPILHGKNGEDGRLQGLLELAGIPFVGCDMASSAICMDKYIAHKLVECNGFDIPESYLFQDGDDYQKIKEAIATLTYPIFVKPLKAGSSYGITKVNQQKDLKEAIQKAFSYDHAIIIEENIDGFEVGCAILGKHDLIIGEVDEIELQDGFFDTYEKYNLKTSQIHLPARLSREERKRIQEIALAIYRILGCSGFARVDMFYTKDHRVVFNEVNTIPGCTSHSRYPSMLKEVGYSFSDVIEQLIDMELSR